MNDDRINGTHASENKKLLQDILRNEWQFDGLVMSDWKVLHRSITSQDSSRCTNRFGVFSIDHALNAGLDLEMPGTNKYDRGLLNQARFSDAYCQVEDIEPCATRSTRIQSITSHYQGARA